jgi:predicted ATP-grasp superfamily ATP-dependent carboligase
MAGKGGSEKGKKHNYPAKRFDGNIFYKHLIKDIKHNGIAYLRSRYVVDIIKELAPEIEITYNKEDNLFIARYSNKKGD